MKIVYNIDARLIICSPSFICNVSQERVVINPPEKSLYDDFFDCSLIIRVDFHHVVTVIALDAIIYDGGDLTELGFLAKFCKESHGVVRGLSGAGKKGLKSFINWPEYLFLLLENSK